MKKIVLAGVLGGLVVFAWGAVSHMLLPIGTMGIKSLPQEETVLGTLRGTVREPGLYFFPGLDPNQEMTPERSKDWEAKYVAGPTGLLVYSLGGEKPLSGRQLAMELTADVVAAVIAAFVVTWTPLPFRKRVVLVSLLGLFAWLNISVSHWVWYRFPTAFIMAEGIDQVVGWLFGGLVIAGLLRSRSQSPVAASPST